MPPKMAHGPPPALHGVPPMPYGTFLPSYWSPPALHGTPLTSMAHPLTHHGAPRIIHDSSSAASGAIPDVSWALINHSLPLIQQNGADVDINTRLPGHVVVVVVVVV